ncbi:hypothetical protein NC652_014102 [Populus alba x Populus x berolinensis]|nr:hypothetical protein NC652_014102 [Populus alba x Populus x berolinensis]
MWSEPVGLSREKTAVLIALFGIASSFGGLFGGKMGGFVTARHPNFGRTVLAHISSASASSSISVSTESEEIATDRGNAASLARALYTSIGLPMALCCLIYSFLYGTSYPRDRERAQMEALIESEMRQLMSDNNFNHCWRLFSSSFL